MTFPEYMDKRVIVTGSSSGIGAAVTESLVNLGGEVHSVDLSRPKVDVASFTFLDLSDPESIGSAIGSFEGGVDALFNCAGAPPMAPPMEVLTVNFLGTRLLTDLVLERMSSGAAIATTSSDGGIAWRTKRELVREFVAIGSFQGGLGSFEKNKLAAGHPYAFGKEALNVWTMQLSTVLIRRGIRINTSTPGAVQTPMLEAIESAFGAE
jgi:NAD(P)-dependent dehydrogenase (short-subunit alcohol dehydrogenase family)